jgi:hypothetical protein
MDLKLREYMGGQLLQFDITVNVLNHSTIPMELFDMVKIREPVQDLSQ